MRPEIFEYSGVIVSAYDRPGDDCDLPGMLWPGVVCRVVEVYEYPNRTPLTCEEAKKITLAVAVRALRDAKNKSKDSYLSLIRQDARAWLRSGGCVDMLKLAGLRVTQGDIDNWIAAGCVVNYGEK